MDYVAVPSLTGGQKTGYEDGGESGMKKLDYKARAERIARNPVFEALSAGLRHNGAAHIQTYMSGKAKGKARARTVTTDSSEDSEDDYGTIFVSRPLKRKGKDRETDEDDPSCGSPLRKKKFIHRFKAVDSASSSSPHFPLSQAPSKAKAKLTPQSKTKRSICDFLLLDVSDDPPPGLLPTTRATLSSIRHLRMAYEVDRGREKIWDARHDVGDEYPEARYAVNDVVPSPSGKKKMKAKPRVAYPAQTKSTATAQLGSIPGGVTDDSRRISLELNTIEPGQYRPGASTSASTIVKTGKARPRVQALESLGPGPHPGFIEKETADHIAGTNPPLSDVLMDNAPSETDGRSTDADGEGEVDMDYFLNDLENHFDTAGTGNIPSDIVMNDNDEEQRGELVSIPTMFSSIQADPLSSLDIYSSEGYVHADHPNQSNMNDEEAIHSGGDLFLPGPDRAENGDDALYPTSNDYTGSPWVSGAESDFQSHSPVDATTDSPLNGTWDGTIDPSLLGGGEPVSQPLTPSPSPPPFADHGTVSNAEASSSRLPVEFNASISDGLPPRRQSSQRMSRPRIRVNYIDVDDLDLSTESDSEADLLDVTRQSGYTSDSMYQSNASDSHSRSMRPAPDIRIPDGSTSASTSTSASKHALEVAPVPPPKPAVPKKRTKAQALTKNSPGVSWCHQCRHYNLVDKMKCTNLRPAGDLCKFMFCLICVEKRYVVYFSTLVSF